MAMKKMIWLEGPKRDALLTILKGWLRAGRNCGGGVPFGEFQSVISKLRHAFISIPNGKGLLSPCNKILRLEPKVVYLHRNRVLHTAIADARCLLQESTLAPTKCTELVSGWPGYVGTKDASKYGVGGCIVGDAKACVPTVFRVEWPEDIKVDLVSEHNPKGRITTSDLELAGLLLSWAMYVI